ncbi:MAG: hypothetical protein P8182_13995 [Deltaproteobacteria bacterium]
MTYALNDSSTAETEPSQAPAREAEKAGLSRSVRIKISLLIFLGAAHLLISFFTIVPGYLSIDEAIYNWTIKDFSKTGGFDIWTGYREFPSVELAHDFLRVHAGRPISQYPYLFPLLAVPFYRAGGFFGVFFINVLSFLGVVVLTFFTARRLFDDINLALNSCFILIFATFAWEYSQAGWPHMLGLLFVMGAFYLCVSAYFSPSARRGWWLALAAGLVAGFAPGIRIDAALIIGCIILPFLFARPWRPMQAIAVAAGTIPGLAILAVTNKIKFGVLNPFSYGTNFGGFTMPIPTGLIVAAAAGLILVWALTRSPVLDRLQGRWRVPFGIVLAILFAVAVISALFVVPRAGTTVQKTVSNAWVEFVDLRALDPGARLPAMMRSPGGGVVYIGAHKKALLQSLPYLVILLVPLVGIARREREFGQLVMLFLVPLAVGALYAYHPFGYGGLCLNYRFFLPILPFASILTAYAIRDLERRWGMPFGWPVIVAVAALTAVVYFLFTGDVFATLEALEFPLLVIPLIIAILLLGLLAMGEFLRGAGIHLIRGAAWLLLIVALTWAGLVAFFYDYPQQREQRIVNFSIGGKLLKTIPRDSILFTAPFIDPVMRLLEGDRVRIGFPGQDSFKDFPRLIAFQLHQGRRVFALFPIGWWRQLQKGPLQPYRITAL